MKVIKQLNNIAILVMCLGLILGGLLTGCGSADSVGGGSAQTGTVAILLTDGPTDEFSAVNVTMNEISLVSDQEGPVVIFSGARRINLLALQEVEDLFTATEGVPVGVYAKIRLKVSDPEFITTSGQTITASQINLVADGKVDLVLEHPIQISEGKTLVLRLDLDAEKSILIHISDANEPIFEFRPVIFVEVLNDLHARLVSVQGEIVSIDPETHSFLLRNNNPIVHDLRTVDQRWEPPLPGCFPSEEGSHDIFFLQPIGQEFTPTRSFLTGVDVQLGVASGVKIEDTITLNVREGDINGPVVATVSVEGTMPAEDVEVRFWQHFDLSPGVNVVPEASYVLELTTTKPGLRWWGGSCPAGTGGYPGDTFISGIRSTEDKYFRTYTTNKQDDRLHLIRIEVSDDTHIFQASGQPGGFDSLAIGQHIHVRGLLSFEDGLHLKARLIEIGQFIRLHGSITTEINAEKRFGFTPDPGQGVTGEILVQVHGETLIFEAGTHRRLTPEDLIAGKQVLIEGVLDVGGEPDLLHAAVIVVKPPEAEVTHLEGTISDLNPEARTFNLAWGPPCAFAEPPCLVPLRLVAVHVMPDALILRIHPQAVDDGGLSLGIEVISFEGLKEGEMVNVFGQFDPSGSPFHAKVVLVEGSS